MGGDDQELGVLRMLKKGRCDLWVETIGGGTGARSIKHLFSSEPDKLGAAPDLGRTCKGARSHE